MYGRPCVILCAKYDMNERACCARADKREVAKNMKTEELEFSQGPLARELVAGTEKYQNQVSKPELCFLDCGRDKKTCFFLRYLIRRRESVFASALTKTRTTIPRV